MSVISSNNLILEIKQFSNLYKKSSNLQLNKSYYLNTVQAAKCLAIIGFIGSLIQSAILSAVACGAVGLIIHMIKNTISQHVKITNVFMLLLQMQPSTLQDDETIAISSSKKHHKIALLLIAYSCLDQLAVSCEKQKIKGLEELGTYCRSRVDDIYKHKDIREISISMDQSIAAASAIKKTPSNTNVISEAIFCYTPSEIMTIIAEICDGLATSEEEVSFKKDAESAIALAKQLTNTPCVNIRDSIRKDLINSLQLL